MAKTPEGRPSSAGALATELRTIARRLPDPSIRPIDLPPIPDIEDGRTVARPGLVGATPGPITSPAPPAPAPLSGFDRSDGPDHTVTVARPRLRSADEQPAPVSPEDGRAEAAPQRQRILIGAGIAGLFVAIAIAFAVATGGGDDNAAPEPTPTPEASADPIVRLQIPTDVTVTEIEDGTYRIEWTSDDPNAIGFRISPVGSRASERAESSPHVWETPLEGFAACFEVATLGDGRSSQLSNPACANG